MAKGEQIGAFNEAVSNAIAVAADKMVQALDEMDGAKRRVDLATGKLKQEMNRAARMKFKHHGRG